MFFSSIFNFLILTVCFTNESSPPPATVTCGCGPRRSLCLGQLPVIAKSLYVPSLVEIAQALKQNLTRLYEEAEVNLVDCPDLRKEPFNLSSQGLGGKSAIISLGRQEYIFKAYCEKIYDLKTVADVTDINPAFILGAASGPYQYVGGLSEMIIDFTICDKKVISSYSKICEVGESDEPIVRVLPKYITEACFIVDFFVSEGTPGKVVELILRGRKTESDIISTIRSTLANAFSEPIGMGVVIQNKRGDLKMHIQPPYFPQNITGTTEEINAEWLKFYTMPTPQIAVGYLISKYPGTDEATRLFHVHASNQENSFGGHYYGDVTPNLAAYNIYLYPAEKVYQID